MTDVREMVAEALLQADLKEKMSLTYVPDYLHLPDLTDDNIAKLLIKADAVLSVLRYTEMMALGIEQEQDGRWIAEVNGVPAYGETVSEAVENSVKASLRYTEMREALENCIGTLESMKGVYGARTSEPDYLRSLKRARSALEGKGNG